ncbi:MAG: PQQ-binding-like beta-propeller repeat protein [bacterium]
MSLMDKATMAYKNKDFVQELQYSLRLKKHRMDLIWSFKAGDDITSICQIECAEYDKKGCSLSKDHDKQIVLGSRDHKIYSLFVNKEILWEFTANDEITSLFAFNLSCNCSEQVIAGSLDGCIYVLNVHGKLLWKYELDSGVTCVTATKLLDKNIIIAGTTSGTVYIISYMGEVIWKYTYDTNCIINSVCLGNTKRQKVKTNSCEKNNVIAATNRGEVIILDLIEQRFLYKFSLPDKGAIYSILSEDLDFDGQYEILISSDSCVVYLLDCNGRQKWQFQTKDSVYSVHCCDINHDNNYEVLVGTKDNHVYVLNSKGEFMWEYQTNHNVWSIYVGHLVNPQFYDIFTSLSNKTVNYYKLIELNRVSHRIERAYKSLFNSPEEEIKLLEYLSNYEDEFLRGFARSRIINFSKDARFRENIFRFLEKGIEDSSPVVRDESIKALIKMLDIEFDRSIAIMQDLLIYERDSEIRNNIILSIVHASLRIARSYKKTRLYSLLNQLGLAWDQLDKKEGFNLFEKAKDELMTGNYQKALENFELLLRNKIDLMWKYPTSGYVSSIATYDINGDGFEEIILSSRGNQLYVIDHNGTLLWEVKGACYSTVLISEQSTGDKMDIILVYADGTIQFYAYDGKKKKEINLNLSFNIDKAALLKCKDKKDYILICNGESIRLYDLEGTMMWKMHEYISARVIYTYDINKDQREELLIGTRFGEIIAIDGEGNKLWNWQGPTDSNISAMSAIWCKESKEPIIVVGYSSGKVQALDNSGRPKWEHFFNASISNMSTTDFNNNDQSEILVCPQENNIYVLECNGQISTKIGTPTPIRSVSCYQYDHDARKELLLGGDDEIIYSYRIMDHNELEEFIEKTKNQLCKIEGKAHFKRLSVFKTIKGYLESKSFPQKIILSGFLGSGKSEVVWKINTDYLGPGYIPVYFGGLNYIKFKDTASFIFKFLEIIEKGLKRRDINIAPLLKEKFNEDVDATINEFLRSIKQNIDYHQRILLLLDDYHLFENEFKEGRLDNGLFYFFNKILASEKFIFIITIPTQYRESSALSECMEFMSNNSETIDINFLNRYEAEAGIADRLSEYVQDYDEIVEQIIEVSGCHTFLIQIMISEVVRYIQRNKIKSLQQDDHDNIIDNVLPRVSNAMIHPWDSCDCYGKLVLTALAMAKDGIATCSQIRENLGAFGYLITDAKLNTILKNFTNKRILKALFSESEIKYAFSIPLMFIWIRINHSLLDIINQYSISLLKDVPIIQFIKFDSRLKAERKTHVFLESINFDLKRWGILIEFCKKWIALTEKKAHKRGKISDLSLLNGIVKFLSMIFGFTIIDSHLDNDVSIYRFETPTVRLKKLQGMMLICFYKKCLEERDFNILLNRISGIGESEKVFLILSLDDSPVFENRCKDSKLDLVILNSKNILNILFSVDYLRALIDEVILNQISFVDISPYETMGPATNMFFGRIKEIRTVVQHQEKCYAIIGSRRLGKTSLMMQIQHRIEKDRGLRTLYLDCSLYTEDHARAILRFCKDVISRLGFGDMEIEDIKDFKSHIIKCCKEKNLKVSLFLDEIDGMLAVDKRNNGVLFSAFRALYQENYLTLVIAGYEELFFRTKDIQSPLFNFLEVIRLTPLDKESATKLITEPMQELGIEFEEHYTTVQAICDVTSCFPNLIQHLCGQLIRLIGSKNKRKISPADVEEIIEMPEFQNNIIDMFFQHLDTLGKIIVLLIMDLSEFDFYQVDTKLRSIGIELKLAELSEELDKIMLGSLIKREKTKYHFGLSKFPAIFKKTMSPKLLLKQLKKEMS